MPLLNAIAQRQPEIPEIKQLIDAAHNLLRNHRSFSHFPNRPLREVVDSSNPLKGVKILHAPWEIAGNMGRLTRLIRNAGVDATSVDYKYVPSFYPDTCDKTLNLCACQDDEKVKRIEAFAVEALRTYDIFHFHFAHSLYPDLRDLEMIKQDGKKILFSFWGSDARSPEWIYYHQARFLGFSPPKPYFMDASLYKLHKKINRYADVLLGPTCIPRGLFIPGLISLSDWTLAEKNRLVDKKLLIKDPSKVYFVHAPSQNWKKGSSILCRLLEECKREGLPVELLYVHGVSPAKARELYAYADYAIDQAGVGTFGLFGAEMMSWEIPVLTYQTGFWDRLRDNPPVVRITKNTFKQQIRACIEMVKSGEYEGQGRASRTWVEKHMAIETHIPRYISIYGELAQGKRIPQYINTSWLQQEEALQDGVKSAFYQYMKEYKVFDELGSPVPVYDTNLYY